MKFIILGGAMYYGGIVNPYKAYSYEDLVSDSVRLNLSYPTFLRVQTIGLSTEGRKLLLVSLGKGEKKILLCGAHHGREYISASFLMKMAEEYAVYYKNSMKAEGFDAGKILNEVTIHIVPMVNPDGVAICRRALKNKEQPNKIKAIRLLGSSYSEWKANANGVDLNRHYPCLWEKLKTGVLSPASEGFKGYSAASEPEVKAMMRLCTEQDYISSASFHTKGEEIFYADGLTNKLLPQSYPIAKKISILTGYAIADVSQDVGIYAGGFENWFRMLFSKPSFLIELTPYNGTHPHDDSLFDTLVWDKAALVGLLLADEARKL